jgi:hypothetical protein
MLGSQARATNTELISIDFKEGRIVIHLNWTVKGQNYSSLKVHDICKEVTSI